MPTSGPITGLPHHNLNYSPDAIQNYSMNSKIIISSLVILFFIVLIILLLHFHAKWCWRSSANIRQQPQRLPGSRFSQGTSKIHGLDTEILVALPVFTYKSQLSMSPKAVECAVCLSEFQQDDNCKFLPKCKHFFHTNCIDMWFLSNTTCPLCRTTAEFLTCDEEHAAAGSTACHFTHQDGGNDLGPEQHQESSRLPSRGGQRCVFGIRHDLACSNINGDEEQVNEGRGAFSRHDLACSNINGDEEQVNEGRGPFSQCEISQQAQPAPSRRWRRSVSDKFPRISHGVQFPTNVLFWGNHTHVASHINPGHWRVGGRSLPHITIDILTPQESVTVSSCHSLCSSPGPRHSLVRLQPVHDHLPNRLKSLKRLLSK